MAARLRVCLLGMALLAGATGCVERRMVIYTDPVGAIVSDEKNQPMGASPVDRTFTYYGKYRWTIAKDGYETLVVEQRVRAPWYELPGLDFIAENLIPWTIRDVRVYRYVLQRQQDLPPEQLLNQAQGVRDYGRSIGVQPPDLYPAPGSPPSVLMPPVRDP